MGRFLDWLLGLPGPLVYACVGALVYLEDAFFLGLVVPGETAAILGGVVANLGHVTLPAMIGVVVLAAILGDITGYVIGRRLGPRLLDRRGFRRHHERVERTRQLLARRGGVAVFLGRFVAFARTLIPPLAGAARMPVRTFLIWNVLGATAWGTSAVLAGHLAGRSYARLERVLGRTTTITVAVLVAVALLVWYLRRRRARRR